MRKKHKRYFLPSPAPENPLFHIGYYSACPCIFPYVILERNTNMVAHFINTIKLQRLPGKAHFIELGFDDALDKAHPVFD